MPTVNTGQQEKQQRDTNPSSPSFGQLRWLSSGQNLTACPLPSSSYRSAAISQVVYRDDCGSGSSSGVTYAVPAGHIVSTVTQHDADVLALDYFNATSQAFARANATCSVAPIQSRTCNYYSGGCFSGDMQLADGSLDRATFAECQQCYAASDNTGTACAFPC